MLRPGGYATIIDPSSPTAREIDSFTCCHCNGIVFVKPRQDPSEMGGFCRLCMKHTCKNCSEIGGCTPFEKKLDEYERKTRNGRVMAGEKL